MSQHTGIEKTVFGQAEQDDASIVSIPVVSRLIDPTLYFTDTSEIEDLMDSSGVGGPVTPQVKVPLPSSRFLDKEESRLVRVRPPMGVLGPVASSRRHHDNFLPVGGLCCESIS